MNVGDSSDTTQHQFVAAVGLTPTNISHNPNTGLMTITVVDHKLSNGDFIKIADNALTFTCAMDNHATDHTYPRPADPASGSWLKVSNVSGNQFDVQVLSVIPQTNTTLHLFKSAVANSITKSVVKSGGVYNHTYVSSVSNSLLHAGDSVKIAPNLSLIHI